jgi:hypothetical protein
MSRRVAARLQARHSKVMGKDDPDRERRLAEALRANLRRRKAQARGPAPADGGLEDPSDGAAAQGDAPGGPPR